MADTPRPVEMVPDDFQRDYDERQKELNRKILQRVADDPDFRGHLLEDPDRALEKAGLAAEAKALDHPFDSDVVGHQYSRRWVTKYYFRYGIKWHKGH